MVDKRERIARGDWETAEEIAEAFVQLRSDNFFLKAALALAVLSNVAAILTFIYR